MPALIDIYTDGSYSSLNRNGAWAAIIIIDKELTVLSDVVKDSTHNRMELTAVIKSIDYILQRDIEYEYISIYSDSQYVINLPERKNRLWYNEFQTSKGIPIRNADLVIQFINLLESHPIKLIKVKAHQKETGEINYNRQVDKLVRKLVRNTP